MGEFGIFVMCIILYGICAFVVGVLLGQPIMRQFEVWEEEREAHREILEEIRREEER